jgi:hypothetical protein
VIVLWRSGFLIRTAELSGARGGAVVETLRYEPEGLGIDYRWCHPFGRTMALELTLPLTEMSARNISRGVKVAGA